MACSYFLGCSYFGVHVDKAFRLAGRGDEGVSRLRGFQGLAEWVLQSGLGGVLDLETPVLRRSSIRPLGLIERMPRVCERTLVSPPQISLELLLHLIKILLVLLVKVKLLFRLVLRMVRERSLLRGTDILPHRAVLGLLENRLLLRLPEVLLMGEASGLSRLLVALSLLINWFVCVWGRAFSFFPVPPLQGLVLRIDYVWLLVLRRLFGRSLELRSGPMIIRRHQMPLLRIHSLSVLSPPLCCLRNAITRLPRKSLLSPLILGRVVLHLGGRVLVAEGVFFLQVVGVGV